MSESGTDEYEVEDELVIDTSDDQIADQPISNVDKNDKSDSYGSNENFESDSPIKKVQ